MGDRNTSDSGGVYRDEGAGGCASDAQHLCEDFVQENHSDDAGKELKRYKLLKTIGEGTYGVVYRAVDTLHNRAVAVKEMHIDPDNQGLPSVALREISFLGELQHPYIVNLLDVVVCDKTLMLIFEYLDMDLRDFQLKQIARTRRLDFELTKRFTYELIDALAYLHSRHIVHRDMKPQNVLVDAKQLHVKIGDFGLARVFTAPLREMTNEVVTLWYRAPELLLGADVYDENVDIWSVGVMVIEMLENDPPFDPDCEIRGLHMIFQTFGTPNRETWPDFLNHRHYCELFPKWFPKPWKEIAPHAPPLVIDLLKLIFVYPPQERISCRAALQHPLFENARAPPTKPVTPTVSRFQSNTLSPRHMHRFPQPNSPLSYSKELAAAMSSLQQKE